MDSNVGGLHSTGGQAASCAMRRQKEGTRNVIGAVDTKTSGWFLLVSRASALLNPLVTRIVQEDTSRVSEKTMTHTMQLHFLDKHVLRLIQTNTADR
jgi:hypothetical protein